MELKGSLQHLQEPSTGPYPGQDQSSPNHSILFPHTFQVPNPISIFHSLHYLPRNSVQARGSVKGFLMASVVTLSYVLEGSESGSLTETG
jgi:hypothetical protein